MPQMKDASAKEFCLLFIVCSQFKGSEVFIMSNSLRYNGDKTLMSAMLKTCTLYDARVFYDISIPHYE